MQPATLGGQLLAGQKAVEIFKEPLTVCAEIGQVRGLSAHGDQDDLLQFTSNQSPEKVKGIFLVHGEPAVQKAFAEKLSVREYRRIEYPARHDEFELPLKVKRKRKHIPLKQKTEELLWEEESDAEGARTTS